MICLVFHISILNPMATYFPKPKMPKIIEYMNQPIFINN